MPTRIYGFDEGQYSRVVDTVRAVEGGTLSSDKKRIPPRLRELARIPFHNDSGETIPAWGVMRIADAPRDTNSNWRLTARKPNDTFYNCYLVNGPQDVATSGDGTGSYLWHANEVLCDSTYTPTAGQEWGPTSGSWALVRHRPGFLIDGGPTGSGATYRAVAKQRIVTVLRGILTTELVEQGSCTVNLRLKNAATGLREATGITVTAYDDFLGPGETWPVSTRVVIDYEGGQWNVIQASCSPDSGGGGAGGGGGVASQSPGAGAELDGDFFPGGLDYGEAEDIYGGLQEFDSLLGV